MPAFILRPGSIAISGCSLFLIANRDQIRSDQIKRVVDVPLWKPRPRRSLAGRCAQQLYMVRSAGPSVGQSPNLQCVHSVLITLSVGKLQVTVRLAFPMTVGVHLPVAFCVPFNLLGTRRLATSYSLFYSVFPAREN